MTFNMDEQFNDDQIPYFCWDRKLTVKDIRHNLKKYTGTQKMLFIAWIMREAAFRDVWLFLTPKEVWNTFSELKRFLGRKKDFWEFTLKKWHELGKI
jgi:hypothetical protein